MSVCFMWAQYRDKCGSSIEFHSLNLEQYVRPDDKMHLRAHGFQKRARGLVCGAAAAVSFNVRSYIIASV